MDDVTIIDDMAMSAARLGAATPQGENRRRALEAFESIVVKMHPQPLADQSRGNRVKHLAQDEGAGTGDVDMDLLVVGGLAERQLFQRESLLLDALGVAGVAAADDLVDEAPPCRQRLEVARGSQQEGVIELTLEMAVGTLDRTVLVADARIVAGRRHAVIGAERLVARRQILLRLGAQIAERRRQAVGAVLFGNATERPQRVLQPFGQRDEAFAAEHDMSVFEARERQAEVIQPAVEVLAGDGDAEIGYFGEVRQSHPARRMLLAEDHLPVRPVHCLPTDVPPLKRARLSGNGLYLF